MKKTIYDIAKELGLAPSTISKVLNNTGSVSDETRERVIKHVKASGYVTASNARILKSKYSYTIGVIFSEESNIGLEHPFFSSVLQNFKVEMEKFGYELVFIVTKLGNNEMTYLQWCRNKKVDGVLIVVGDANEENLINLAKSDIPCVSTDLEMEGVYTVISDNHSGVVKALDFCESLGFSKIAMIPGPLTSRAFLSRFESFESLMKERNLYYDASYVSVAESFGYTSGYNAARYLLENAKTNFEAVLVGSDDIAVGVIRGLESMGKRVPEDISVIGFDDINLARHYTPSLTTIRQDRATIGHTAAHVLKELIQTPEVDHPQVTKIEVELVIRNSTKGN